MPTNLERIRAAFKIWRLSSGQNSAPWFDLADENIVFISAAGGREPAGPVGNSTRKAALQGYFDFIATKMEMIEHEIEHYLEDADLVIAIGHSCWRIRSTGRVFKTRTANLFWFRDGKIVRYENCYDSAALLDAATPDGAPGLERPPNRPRRR